jgi:hypothetical protein
VLEAGDGAGDRPEDVEVGGFGGECHSQGGVGGGAIEAGAAEAGAGHEVGYGFHLFEDNRDALCNSTERGRLI